MHVGLDFYSGVLRQWVSWWDRRQ